MLTIMALEHKKTRPPVITVMGHVDHGKTSLLDYARKMAYEKALSKGSRVRSVAEREAGGITQSIGAYEVEISSKEGKSGKITFIDTPGHEAFTKMRTRGAVVADLVILVVAADDGVKPQTKEAIEILQNTNTPYLVAITKIDKNNADVDRVKNDLMAHGVLLEGFGGNISWQGISSTTGEGIDELLELVLLHAEIEGFTYDENVPGRGYVIESHKDNRRGVVASVILKDGIIKEGDKIATESASGKIKSLEDFMGKRVKSLSPSAPAEIVGFLEMPKVGEEFWVGEAAENIAAEKKEEIKEQMSDEDADKLKAILKADTSGSLEALKQVMGEMVYPVSVSVGDITPGDIRDAISTGSVIIAFGVKLDKTSENQAQIHDVTIFSSNVVYELVKQVEDQLKREAALGPNGELKALKVFSVTGRKQLVGCEVSKGVISNKSDIEVVRNKEVVGTGKITSLQVVKDKVEEVSSGECGVVIEANVGITEGDVIKVY